MAQKSIINEKVYEVTQVKPWSQTIKIRQMQWFGHLRLPETIETLSRTTGRFKNRITE